jgi:Ni/Co efflux regulator RcnB
MAVPEAAAHRRSLPIQPSKENEMATIVSHASTALLLGSLITSAPQVSAQRAAGGGTTRTHTQSTRQTSHQGTRTMTANRNVNTHHNTNVNRNVNVNHNTNVNRNVNVTRNVNVNRNVHWSGNRWGGAPIAASRYAWPHGYGYARRSVGWVMPRSFLGAPYYYAGWATLGLMAPPAHYQWVRYGPDLLLVNTLTGQVTDVRYGVFAG